MADQPSDSDKQISEEAHGRYAHPAEYYDYRWAESRDEVSLFDIWDALVRRKWIILGMTVVVTVLAAGYAAYKPERFRYSQVVDIGTWIADGKMQAIESADSVAAKLEESFIPAGIRSWMEGRSTDEWAPRVEASARKDTDIVVLRSEGTDQQAEAISLVMEQATSAVEADHDQIFRAIREQLKLEVAQAQTELGTLKADMERAQAQLQRADERQALLQEEISELQESLGKARDRRNEAISGRVDGNSITLMLVNDEIQATRRQISEFRRELRIGIPEERDEAKRVLAGIKREAAEQQAELRAAQSSLDNLAQTRVMSEPERSIQPVGTSSTVVVSLGLILGAMLGVFAAFAAEFVAAARRRREQGGDDQEI